MLGPLSVEDQQRCPLIYLPFDEAAQQMQQPVPIGGR
jgi:hypothetical protein